MVMEEAGGGGVLGDGEVEASVLIEICHGAPSAIPMHLNTRLRWGEGGKLCVAVATEEQPGTGVEPDLFWSRGTEVLGEEEIDVAIAVEVPCARS